MSEVHITGRSDRYIKVRAMEPDHGDRVFVKVDSLNLSSNTWDTLQKSVQNCAWGNGFTVHRV